MSDLLHSFSDLALAVGRFEMESIANRGTRQDRSVVGLGEATALGLFEAAQIIACAPDESTGSRVRLLDDLGERLKKHWRLRAPVSDSDRKNWGRLLATDQVLVFIAPEDKNWLAQLTGRLYSPFVAAVPSASLSFSWESFERTAFKERSNLVHVSCGGRRTTFTFVGSGDVFVDAVTYAAQQPPMMWGYPPAAFKETLRSRKLIFPEKRRAAE